MLPSAAFGATGLGGSRTGAGKAYLVTQAAKLAQLPIHVFDATTLTENGSRGRDAADILKDYAAANIGCMNCKYGVILLDEADKMAAVGDPERQVFRRTTQHALLKLMEGVEQEGLDSSRLLFVLAGASPGIAKQNRSTWRPLALGAWQSRSRRRTPSARRTLSSLEWNGN